jgi:nucleotide-binding universal stress UspA family protein
MYQSIYVPLDNSDHSNVAAELGLGLAKVLGAGVVGSHAYAAALHDVRFKQMEFTLPDEYKDETELEKQRRIHDSLITRGLVLISDSYLDRWQRRAAELGVAFEGKHFDGKNFDVIVRDIEESSYDLVVLGALGQGAVKDSEVGSVCERVLRRIRVDAWVVRDLEAAAPGAAATAPRTIVVGIDGSPHSFGGLRTACELARRVNAHLDLVTVGEDDGALERALAHASGHGISASATRLTGHPGPAFTHHLERVGAWLVVVGRLGSDAAADNHDVGSLSERLVRRAPCNVFLSSRTADSASLSSSGPPASA